MIPGVNPVNCWELFTNRLYMLYCEDNQQPSGGNMRPRKKGLDWDDEAARKAYYRDKTREWRERGNNRELDRLRTRLHQAALKDEIYAAYGGYVCACCGETVRAFLSIDHVNNDGAEHRKVSDRRKLYWWLKKHGFPSGFQVLCMNCNFGKARNNGVCPHVIPEGSTTIAKASTPQAYGGGSAGLLPVTFGC